MVVDEAPILAEPGDPENAGHRSPAGRQDSPDEQNTGMPPSPLQEERREAQDHGREAAGQVQHGYRPRQRTFQLGAASPYPSATEAENWPKSR